MSDLESISTPSDLRALDPGELDGLAAEIRDLLIRTVATNTGHLGPNPGVVELTLAIHPVFESPKDKGVFDNGHQSYVQKLLTRPARQLGPLPRAGVLRGSHSHEETQPDPAQNTP